MSACFVFSYESSSQRKKIANDLQISNETSYMHVIREVEIVGRLTASKQLQFLSQPGLKS